MFKAVSPAYLESQVDESDEDEILFTGTGGLPF